MNIYFVCTGNTCRSPMAEAILKSKQLPHVQVKSAGIYAADGGSMSMHAQTILENENMTHQHRSKHFNAEDVAWADVILTMTNSHKQMILQTFEAADAKTFTLKEYVGLQGDVLDPFGGTLETYEMTFKQLQQLIAQIQIEQRDANEKNV